MPDSLPDINLLPKYERQSSSNSVLFIVLIIFIILSYILFAVYYFQSKSKVEEKETEYIELSDQEQVLQAELDNLESGGGTSSLSQAVTFAEYYNIPTSVLIEELNELLPERGYLIEYSYTNQGAQITTHFETLDKVAAYTEKLTTSELLTDTRLDNVTTFNLKEEQDDTEIDFTTISRYESTFTLRIHKDNLKGAQEEDE